MNEIDDQIYVDIDGLKYWKDSEGEPDFDDPVITLKEWLIEKGFTEEKAINIENDISSTQGRRS